MRAGGCGTQAGLKARDGGLTLMENRRGALSVPRKGGTPSRQLWVSPASPLPSPPQHPHAG